MKILHALRFRRASTLPISYEAPKFIERCSDTASGVEFPRQGEVSASAPGILIYANYTWLFVGNIVFLAVEGLVHLGPLVHWMVG
jgi:hypothetical protein